MLYLPQGKEEFVNFGTIRVVGGGVEVVAVGDRVIFQRKPSSAIDPESRAGDEYYGMLVLPEDHVVAVLDV